MNQENSDMMCNSWAYTRIGKIRVFILKGSYLDFALKSKHFMSKVRI
jgi:hypothetical protein